jgi:CRP/FNR family transcriptional regulator
MTHQPGLTSLIEQLRSIAFLKRLDQPTLDALAHGALWREYAVGEVVFVEGESSSGLYVLHSGWLKVLKNSTEGREQVLRFIGPGETFNEIGVFANRPNPATAIALEATGVWLLQREAVLELLRTRPEFAQHVIENMADRVIDLVTLVADLSLRPVTARLARLLLEDATGDVLHRPRWYTQTELASRLGTVPDVVQRALRTLEGDSVLEVERHLIRIRDRAALEKLAA